MSLEKETIDKYLISFKKKGPDLFYEAITNFGLNTLTEKGSCEVQYLSFAEYFFSMYRKTGEEDFFEMAKCFRRAAHKIYRQYLKIDKGKEINKKFLNIIK